jgi:glutaminyl-peptide cyclotransferase
MYRRKIKSKSGLIKLSRALLAFVGCLLAAVSSVAARSATGEAPTAPVYRYAVDHARLHDPGSFTEGLAYHAGYLIESAGLRGQSSLRRVAIDTGRVVRSTALPGQFWAEGVALLGNRIYQLTYQEETGFVYDLRTFRRLRTFHYEGEGWGLTADGSRLIMSDGSNTLTFRDPKTFAVRRTLEVHDGGEQVAGLNELEVVRGAICANIYTTPRIACIDAKSGQVRYWLDLTGLLPARLRSGEEGDANGIAYDSRRNRLFVTGKFWPRLYQIHRVRSAS